MNEGAGFNSCPLSYILIFNHLTAYFFQKEILLLFQSQQETVVGGFLLKSGKALALVLVIFLLMISSLYSTQSVDAQDSAILTPDLTVTGTLSSTHLSDYYRIEISQYGVYTIELNSTGSSLLQASFNRYYYGYPSIIEECYSNTSSCFTILSSSQYLGSFYQLEVSIDEISDSNLAEYIVSIERVEPIVLEEGREYNIQQDGFKDSHYILDATGPSRTYRLNASAIYYGHFSIYNSYGLRVYYESLPYFTYTIDNIFLLDPGIYHLYIDSSSYSENNITFQITPEDIPILEPGSSIQVDFAGYTDAYVLLPLTEGKHYSIELGPPSAQDVGFQIFFDPDYRMQIDDRDAGFLESVTDFVYWDNCMAYTDWERGPDLEYTPSDPHLYRSDSIDAVQESGLLLRAFSNLEGGASLTLTEVQDVQIISSDVPVTAQFDGVNGPFWYLYKFDNFAGGELHNFELSHTPINDYTLNPSYAIYTPEITDQYYLSRTRPFLSEIEITYWDNIPGTSTSLYYNRVGPFSNAYYYHPIPCETWLYVSIPDAYSNDHYYYPIQSGSMEFEVHSVEPILQTVNSEFTMDPSLETSIYSIQLEGDSIYEITVTGTNYQSVGYLSLWNETGHQLPSSYYGYSAQTDRNTRHYQIEVECSGVYNLVVTADGVSPIKITVSKKTASIGVQYPFFIGGLAVAAVEGVIVGIVIGKVKFGKSDAG